MDIAIVGANGDVGRQTASQLIARQLLTPRQRLQLVGRAGGASERALYGLRADLYDAFAEITPEIDVALAPDEIAADLIIFTAGATSPTQPNQLVSREDLARSNLPVFRAYAEAIARNGHGEELVIMVTNPVELGVAVFSQYLDRSRVIGMGAYQDSMRFRREIARDLGMRRQRVLGYVLGEHGDGMVPIWSDVSLYGFDAAERADALARIGGDRDPATFADAVLAEKRALKGLLDAGEVDAAFRHAESLAPDLRCVILPLVTHVSGAKTAVSTAASIVEMAEQILSGHEMVTAAQVQLVDGEYRGIDGVVGVPVVCSARGWTNLVEINMTDAEHARLAAVASDLRDKIGRWLSD